MRRGSRPSVRVHLLAAALAAVAIALLPAAPAAAHDYLVASSPAAGGTVTAPIRTVSLTFDAAVLTFGRGANGVVVTGPDGGGRHYETGCARVQGDTVTAPVALGGPGRYAVSWRIVSADGHPVSDTIAFTYRPGAGAAVSPGSATGPSCGVAVGRPEQAGAGGSGVPVLVIGVAAGAALLIAAALVAAVLVLRRAGAPRSRAEDRGRGPEG